MTEVSPPAEVSTGPEAVAADHASVPDQALAPGRVPWSSAERRSAWIGVVIAVGLFLLVATHGQPWHLFDRGPFSTDFYDAQARALAHGHLDVAPQVAGLEGFVVDGKTQLYFGVGPALMRLPFTAWGTGLDGRLALLSQLGAVALLGVASSRLLARARALVPGSPRGRPWWFTVAAVVPSLATPVLYLATRPLVYHEAELWGAATGLAGIDLVLRWRDRPTARHLLEATAFAVFAISCRPSTGAAPAIAVGLFGLWALARRQWRPAAALLACGIIPVVGFLAVNQVRFGSPTDVPFPLQVQSGFDPARQSALAANDGSLLGLKFVPTALVQYLSPFAVEPQRLFPFVTWGEPAHVIGGVTFDSIHHSSSIPTGAPALLVLAVVGAWWTLRRDRSGTWRVVVIAAAAPTVLTFSIALVAQRYLVDLVPVLVLMAAPAVWLWARKLGVWPRWKQVTSISVVLGLALVGVWIQGSLTLEGRAFTVVATRQDQLELARFQYDLDGRLFGGRPPDVVQLEGDELPEFRDGQLVILGECSGLYRSDGFGWSALEWAPGHGRRLILSGEVGDGPTPVATGAGWSLVLVPEGRGVRVVHHADTGVDTSSEVVPLGDDPVEVDVAADPTTGQLEVSLDGDLALSAVYLPTSGLRAAPGWDPRPGAAPMCESLLERMAP